MTTLLDILATPALAYDYSQIHNPIDREAVQRCAADIKPRLRRAAEDIVTIGQRLTEVKDHLPHGQWSDWLTTEFDMSHDTALNFMRVADRFSGKNGIIPNLTPTALYLLARPSTPDAAIQEVEQRIKQGDVPTVGQTKKIIEEKKTTSLKWEDLAESHLLLYKDRFGNRWDNLRDTQLYHANSPCCQAFKAKYPSCPNPQSALKKAYTSLKAGLPPAYRPNLGSEDESISQNGNTDRRFIPSEPDEAETPHITLIHRTTDGRIHRSVDIGTQPTTRNSQPSDPVYIDADTFDAEFTAAPAANTKADEARILLERLDIIRNALNTPLPTGRVVDRYGEITGAYTMWVHQTRKIFDALTVLSEPLTSYLDIVGE